jgi:hypothetical protein
MLGVKNDGHEERKAEKIIQIGLGEGILDAVGADRRGI